MSLFDTPISRRRALERISLLVGGTLAAPLASGLLAGCRTPESGTVYTYQVLDPDQQRLLAALVDEIIPATDTPGASEAGVPQFIDKMLAEWYAPEQREQFLAGLAAFDEEALRETNSHFADLDAEARTVRVAALDVAAFSPREGEPVGESTVDEDVVEAGQEGTYAAEEEADNEVAGMQGEMGNDMSDDTPATREGSGERGGDSNVQAPAERSRLAADAPPFYPELKQLTIAGYYTSEIGATQELRYNAVMGRYDPDVPFSEIGRAWA